MALDRIADKWTVLIVGRLAAGTQRFGELRRDISGISPKVLTQKLRELERDGILTRQIYATIPPRVDYNLTSLGRTLIELVGAMRTWAEAHIEEVLDAQQKFDLQSSQDEPR